MKVAVEEMESCKRRLVVEAPADVVTKEWERAYDRVQKQARLPGFRKGHVPRSLVKVHFADDVRLEVAQHLIPDVYRQALSEVRLDPVGEPDLQDVRFEEGAHTAAPVTGSDVDATLDRMREQQAEFRDVERAATPGDLVIVDYTLTIDGEQPVQQSGYAFMVGDGSVMPEVDQAVAGMRTGEQRQVGFRLPDDYRKEALRGKSGTGELKLIEVKEKILPELNDDFAKSLGEFATLEALRAEVVKQLKARRASEERHALEEKVVDTLLGRQAFAVPESMIMRQIAHQVEHARERMRRQGVDPEGVQWDYPKLIGELRPGAERAVRRGLLLEAVAEREGFAPTDAAVDAEIEKLAQASQRPAPAVRRMMEKSGDLKGLRQALRERMTLEFLVNHATVKS